MSMAATLVIYAALFFGAGWGWGQWWAERCARRERRALEVGRLNVSMPVNPDSASETLRVLSVLMKQVDAAAAHHSDERRKPPNVRGEAGPTAGRQARTGENVPRTTRPGLVACRWASPRPRG